MINKISFSGYKAILIIFFLFIRIALFSQIFLFQGIVKDERTLEPIPDVNITVFRTTRGTSSDYSGRFSINFDTLPAALIFTCLGYGNGYYKVTEIPKNPVEFLLNSKSYTLKEINITASNYSFVFRDKDYSVLHYELMGDNILLLVYRTLLKQSQLVLLNRSGDTLAVSPLPEVPPSGLFKDFLSNIHYFSASDASYQCSHNKASECIDFLYKTTVDSVKKFIKPFLFKIEGRLYFQESIANKFGTAIGYYEKGTGKKYMRQVVNYHHQRWWL